MCIIERKKNIPGALNASASQAPALALTHIPGPRLLILTLVVVATVVVVVVAVV